MEIEDPIWNTFCYFNFLQLFTDFEITWRFYFKFELSKNWSVMLIGTTNANPPELISYADWDH
jgi:hypothetical protein